MRLFPPIINQNQNPFCKFKLVSLITRKNIKTNKFSLDTVSTIGAVLWENFPSAIKNSDSLDIFKHKIKQ